MFKKILYAGSGDDLKPLTIFPSSHFVCIDSLPRNSYGYPYYYRGFYHKFFKKRITNKLSLSFQQTNEKVFSDLYSEINVPNLDSHLVSFEKKENEGDIHQSLNYYFSTGIPENLYDGNGDLNEDLTKDISECDAIFIKGHWPHSDISLYITNPIHFIGAYSTYFPENKRELEEVEKNTIISYFFDHPETVSSYSYLTKREHLTTFRSYNEFYQFYKEHKQQEDDD